MKLIIDIPEELYKQVKTKYIPLPRDFADIIDKAINNGTPYKKRPTVDTTFREVVAYECGQKSVERPQGEWIEESSETGALGIKYTWVRCNRCGWNNSLVIPKNFCPNCGADMRGDKDE